MAGSDRKPDMPRSRQRAIPDIERGGYSRSSRAVGRQGPLGMQRVEQRSNAPTPRPRVRNAAVPRHEPVARNRQGRGSPQVRRGSGAEAFPRVRRPAAQPPQEEQRESRLLQWLQNWWGGMTPSEQKRVTSGFFLFLSLLLFASLTFLGTSGFWQNIKQSFIGLFGWSAYLLSIGLITLFALRFYEGWRNKHMLRSSTILGAIALWLLVLLESRLIMGKLQAGWLADTMALPLLNWPAAIAHILVTGLILVVSIFTFRITFAHVLLVIHFIDGIINSGERQALKGKGADLTDTHSNPFRGQRPQFSRYSSRRSTPGYDDEDDEDDHSLEVVTPRGRRPIPRKGMAAMPPEPVLSEEDEVLHFDDTFDSYNDYNDKTIAVQPDDYAFDQGYQDQNYQDQGYQFEDEEEYDPDNDINIHKHQISRVPRDGIREPQPLDLTEHMNATHGALQQRLPLNHMDADDRTIADDNSYVDDGPITFEDDLVSSTPSAPLILDTNNPSPSRAGRENGRQPRIRGRGYSNQDDDEPHPPANNAALSASGSIPAIRGASTPPIATPPVQNVAVTPPARGSKKKVSQAANAANEFHYKSVGWKLPSNELLHQPDMAKLQMMGDDTAELAKIIQDTLRSFRVEAEVRQEDISIGPTIIRFGIRPTGKAKMVLDEKQNKMVPVCDSAGQIVYETRTRVSRIMALQNDLALVLEAKTIRMEAPVPGRPYIGVEIPNKNSRLVTLREVLESKEYIKAKEKSKLAVVLGRDVAGQVRVGDLAKMPHLLIAGATGAGKSVMINAIIASLLMQATPDDVRLSMVDPKMVELSMYNGIPHLLSPVVTDVDKVVALLKNSINEMERRYRLFSQLGVRNLEGYRKLRQQKRTQGDITLNNLPSIVIIIDELADLMMAAPEEVESMICRLAQLARATGIHLVVATQRPSVDVITGLIKANIPTRISFMVSSAVDSRTIIDMGGAERLLGRGDMLYLPADAGRPERIQGAFLSDDEAQALAQYWQQQIIEHAIALGEDPQQAKAQAVVEPGWELKVEQNDEFDLEDELLDRAEEVVREYGRASISLLQRRLKVGYSRAARLIDLLEDHGIIGQSEPGGRAREVYDNAGGGHGNDEGTSMSDVAHDIEEEERQRDDFIRKQAAKRPIASPGMASRSPIDADE
jgi:DNA segregation ATPase FtsK/SpoIIIE and related proteins